MFPENIINFNTNLLNFVFVVASPYLRGTHSTKNTVHKLFRWLLSYNFSLIRYIQFSRYRMSEFLFLYIFETTHLCSFLVPLTLSTLSYPVFQDGVSLCTNSSSFAFFQPDHSIEYWDIRNDGICKRRMLFGHINTRSWCFWDGTALKFFEKIQSFNYFPMLLILFWEGTTCRKNP